jgi:pyruvate,orthophosphate dikinase
MQVLANAESLKDVHQIVDFGAEGVGLCRTEHMFFQKARMHLFRLMILSGDLKSRCNYLSQMLPMHQEDFKDVFRSMRNRFLKSF